MSIELFRKDEMSITRFWGGEKKGQMYQLTLGGWHIHRDKYELQELLRDALWSLKGEFEE